MLLWMKYQSEQTADRNWIVSHSLCFDIVVTLDWVVKLPLIWTSSSTTQWSRDCSRPLKPCLADSWWPHMPWSCMFSLTWWDYPTVLYNSLRINTIDLLNLGIFLSALEVESWVGFLSGGTASTSGVEAGSGGGRVVGSSSYSGCSVGEAVCSSAEWSMVFHVCLFEN